MLSALAAALCGGLILAIVLPSAAALSAPWGLRWQALAQVHGHILVVGWVGFFIIGMATRLLPRFSGSPLKFARCIPIAFALIAMALALRSVAQPLSDAGPARSLLPVSGGLEVAGTALFALCGMATLRRRLVERTPFAYFLAAGAVWFVVEAMLTTWALTRMARANAIVVAGADDAPILHVQFFGFLLCFIFGVSLRSIPTFFSWKPPHRLPWIAWALLQGGIVTLTMPAVLSAYGMESYVAANVGRLMLAVALLGVVACMGVWRPASRLRGSVQPVGLLLRMAYGWIVVAALVLAAGSVDGLAHAAPSPGYFDDAVRHSLALGVISTMIVAMSYLVGPMFAQERTEGHALGKRIRLYAVLLGGATLLRVGGALLQGLGVTSERYWPMAAAGLLALAAVSLFAWRLVYGIRHPYVPVIPVHAISVSGRGPRLTGRD